MRRLHWISALALLFGFVGTALGQQQAGGQGLLYVHSAQTIGKKHLNAYFHTRFFGKVGRPTSLQAVTYWDVQGSFALNYGISDRLEVTLLPIVYQDTNRGPTGYNIPDDIFLRLKIGSLGRASSHFKYGFMVASRFPTAKQHNIIYEPYSAGTVEVGFSGLLSYFDDLLFPDQAFNAHFNIGYWFHNDAGNRLTNAPGDTISNKSISSEIVYGIGFRYPFDRWDVTMEINGNFFIQKPAVTAYSRENYLFFTPGVSYKVYKWLRIDFGCDFRLTPDKEETEYIFGIRPLPQQLPSTYPDWRVHMAVKVALLPASLYRESERDILMRKAETRREIFEQIVREQRETEEAEKELERIKRERMKAEQELMRLRKLLEGAQAQYQPEKEPSKKKSEQKKKKKEKEMQ